MLSTDLRLGRLSRHRLQRGLRVSQYHRRSYCVDSNASLLLECLGRLLLKDMIEDEIATVNAVRSIKSYEIPFHNGGRAHGSIARNLSSE